MSEHDWTEVVGAIGIFTLLVSVITVTIVQAAKTRRARTAGVREEEYRRLVDSAVQAQESNARMLAALDGRLNGMETRLGSLERVLKDVE
ncbi:hypothetical protein Q3W71_07135 [Micromonospora sp. C28SCA-DRY-2]|uniref:hypothetical protein n=1 Tax=Micromonospora sp. C28SCA-DRY-2 TaxID=3059522 RepID=UPI002675CDC5|nr:hypothetical protein [Micromonospora sp. C28SCA-DRY-2]MDO3701453.1 hypothetical protein [Micromonospora sp. C28SCA-DRY-2]